MYSSNKYSSLRPVGWLKSGGSFGGGGGQGGPHVPYSRKYWRSLNLAVLSQMTFLTPFKIWRYGMVSPYVHVRGKIFGGF